MFIWLVLINVLSDRLGGWIRFDYDSVIDEFNNWFDYELVKLRLGKRYELVLKSSTEDELKFVKYSNGFKILIFKKL